MSVFWTAAMGDANSIIDRSKGEIILRTGRYPKTGFEFIISGDTIVFNEMKRKGVVTETIRISEISELTADLGKLSGDFCIRGNNPKLWSRGLSFNVPDAFVAYEAYMYIAAKRMELSQAPFKHTISPVLAMLKESLDKGEFDGNKEAWKAKGVHF